MLLVESHGSSKNARNEAPKKFLRTLHYFVFFESLWIIGVCFYFFDLSDMSIYMAPYVDIHVVHIAGILHIGIFKVIPHVNFEVLGKFDVDITKFCKPHNSVAPFYQSSRAR